MGKETQYQLLRKILSTGDIVYIDALDRMGRNYDEVISEWKYITRELQAEGIAVAKSQGKHLGRPQLNLSTLSTKQLFIIEETYPKWKNREITGVKFMELLELKKILFIK